MFENIFSRYNRLKASLIAFIVSTSGAVLLAAWFTDEFQALLKAPFEKYEEDAVVVFRGPDSAIPALVFGILSILAFVTAIISVVDYFNIIDELKRSSSENASLHKKTELLTEKSRKLKEDIHIAHTTLDEMLQTQLASLAQKLRFGDRDHNDERISVYLPSRSSHDTFYLAARFSYNPKWKEHSNKSYSMNKGVVGAAWSDGKCFDNLFPRWNTKSNKRAYKKRCKEVYEYAAGEIEQMRMNCSLYFGWAVMDLGDIEHAGVVLVEALDPERWSKADLESVFQQQRQDLRGFVHSLAAQHLRNDYIRSTLGQEADDQ